MTANRFAGRPRPAPWLERFGSRVSRRLPPPPLAGPLARIEQDLVDALLERHRAALEDARSSDGGALAEILGARMLGELRARMECIPWDRPLLALAARLDQALPTSEGEYMDDHRVAAAERESLVRTLDVQTHRAGDYLILADLVAPLAENLTGRPDGGPPVLLDLASGPGGFPIALARMLGPPHGVRVVATDVDERYLDQARTAADREDLLRWMRFQRLDVFHISESLGGWRPDVITCTRSLHHFGVRGTIRVLTQALRSARRGIVFVDIARSISRMLMAGAAGVGSGNWRFLHDAVLSVRKAFTPGEARLICACVPGAAGLEIFYTPPAYLVIRGSITRDAASVAAGR